MKNLEKSTAAYILSDEIYAALKNISLGQHLVGGAFELCADDADLDDLTPYELRYRLSELSWHIELLVQQIYAAKEVLSRLDAAAQVAAELDREEKTATQESGNNPGQAQEVLCNLRRLNHAQKEKLCDILHIMIDGGDVEWPDDYLAWKNAQGRNATQTSPSSAFRGKDV